MNSLDDLPGLRVFERVVNHGSLTAAAAELGLSTAAASKRLSALERKIGSQLIHRNTRSLSVSHEGKLLYGHVARILEELERAQSALSGRQGQLSGELRITAPNSLGRRLLVPILARFLDVHPQIRINLHLSDAIEDLISGNFDVAVRYGELPDSRLVARRLLANQRILCASPDYLRSRPTLQTPEDLRQHKCLLIGNSPRLDWQFAGVNLPIAAAVVCNDGEAVHAMALAGMGIALKSAWDVAEDLASGRLKQVLPHCETPPAPVNAVFPVNRYMAPRLRAFIDFLVEEFQRQEQSPKIAPLPIAAANG